MKKTMHCKSGKDERQCKDLVLGKLKIKSPNTTLLIDVKSRSVVLTMPRSNQMLERSQCLSVIDDTRQKKKVNSKRRALESPNKQRTTRRVGNLISNTQDWNLPGRGVNRRNQMRSPLRDTGLVPSCPGACWDSKQGQKGCLSLSICEL